MFIYMHNVSVYRHFVFVQTKKSTCSILDAEIQGSKYKNLIPTIN